MAKPSATDKPLPSTTHTKRTRVDNAEGAAAAFADAAAKPIDPPDHITLTKEQRPFWDAILRARARDEWGRVELVLAAQLAGVQADIESDRALLASGDREAMEERGYPSVKAVRAAMGVLIGQQVLLMRALRMIGTVVGDPIDEVPRRKAEREAERTINQIKEGAKARDSNAEAEDEPPLLAL